MIFVCISHQQQFSVSELKKAIGATLGAAAAAGNNNVTLKPPPAAAMKKNHSLSSINTNGNADHRANNRLVIDDGGENEVARMKFNLRPTAQSTQNVNSLSTLPTRSPPAAGIMSKLASTTGLISALNGPNSSPNFSAQSVP
jgi:hypothetical protein